MRKRISATDVTTRSVLIVEEHAHWLEGHFPVRFAQLADAYADLGFEVDVLTTWGWSRQHEAPEARFRVHRFEGLARQLRRVAGRVRPSGGHARVAPLARQPQSCLCGDRDGCRGAGSDPHHGTSARSDHRDGVGLRTCARGCHCRTRSLAPERVQGPGPGRRVAQPSDPGGSPGARAPAAAARRHLPDRDCRRHLAGRVGVTASVPRAGGPPDRRSEGDAEDSSTLERGSVCLPTRGSHCCSVMLTPSASTRWSRPSMASTAGCSSWEERSPTRLDCTSDPAAILGSGRVWSTTKRVTCSCQLPT